MPQNVEGYSVQTMASLRPVKSFPLNTPESIVTNIDFSDNGSLALATMNDETMQVYNCTSGTKESLLKSMKYGCALGRFTHNDKFCIYASTKGNDDIRYLSIEEHKFVRYFSGHKNIVASLEQNPANGIVISCALDRTVRLWDIRSPNSVGKIAVPSPSFATFDPMGVVFGVASQNERTIAMYDARNFDRAPFIRSSAHHIEGSWQKLEFSNDSKLMSVSSDGSVHGLFDAMDGKSRGIVTGFKPLKRALPSTSPTAFTPDGKFLVGGSNDNRLCVWDMSHASDGDFNSVIVPTHETQVEIKPALVSFSPRTFLMASGDSQFDLWLPVTYE